MKRALFVLTALLLGACGSTQATMSPNPTPSIQDCSSIISARTVSTPSTGDTALPDVEVECLQGTTTINLSHLRGPMLISVWASWCEPCAAEMPLMQQFQSSHPEEVLVLGLAMMDETSQAIEGSFNWGVNLPSLEDPDGVLRSSLNVQAPPTTLFIDKDGRIVFRKIGAFSSVQEIETLVEDHLGALAS
ncbi:MAG: hypothetical protein RL410_1592 [Actinomycetota bacterium]